MLGEKMRAHRVNCWLVNTGWTGGPYGAGKRIKLPYTRRMVKAVLAGELENIHCEVDPVFGLAIPDACPGIPNVLLHPRDTWSDKKAYDQQTGQLGRMFVANFEKFSGEASAEVLSAAPRV
jgi:phosphoenolpyruvate carboxykinase (ATP)